ncbi:hypothetical protein ABKV19_006328 [Rosa sericea]
MACGMKQLVVVIALAWVLSLQEHSSSVHGKPQVPCFFIFGDSLADNGNNNVLDTLAKVNYQPYGIDFPSGIATGRFSNGRTTVDVLCVNYACGAAGIRKETGKQLGARISMGRQLKNHKIIISRIVDILGKKRLAQNHLNKCLYSVGMGSNDYINNYFVPQHYHTSKKFTTEQYAEVLINQYSWEILKLYKYGARKVALVGLGLIGCTPSAISSFGTNGSACVDTLNIAAQLFNQRLVSLVEKLNSNLTDAKFIYINSFEMGSGDPAAAGFTVSNVGCCAVNEVGQCNVDHAPCKNRTEYVFWDGFHPTEALNRITAIRSYNAFNPVDTYPMDISHLVQLQINNPATPAT